jgi:hypothetical protein
MQNDALGLWIFGLATLACVGIAFVLTYVHEVPWVRDRVLSGDRWTAAVGMFLIALPIYLVAGMLFAALR